MPLFNAGDVYSIGALRTTIPIICTLGFTVISLACLAGNAFTGKDPVFLFCGTKCLIQRSKRKIGNTHLATAGGAFGILAACGAYYGTLSALWTQTTTFSFIRLPPIVVAPSNV